MSDKRMEGNEGPYTGEAKEHQDRLGWKKLIKEFSKTRGWKAIDITEAQLKEIGVGPVNVKHAMNAVVDIICEYYGIKIRELKGGQKVVDKYKIKDNHMETLLQYSDIGIAYMNFKRQFVGDSRKDENGVQINIDTYDIKLPSEQINVDVDLGEDKILKQMKTTERENLKQMIEAEKDEKKKALYEAQLVVLDLELGTDD